jgi:hypothetical protein
MFDNFIENIKTVWWTTIFGIAAPILLIYCAWNLVDVFKIGYFGKNVNASIISKVEKTCSSGGGRRSRRPREMYPCYDYTIKTPQNTKINFTERESYKIGHKIPVTILEKQPEIYRMGEKQFNELEYLKNSIEFWFALAGSLVGLTLSFGVYVLSPGRLVKSILEAPARLYGYILPTIIVYGSLGYIAYFFELSTDSVKEFFVSLMRL